MSTNTETVQHVLHQCFENLGQCFAAAVADKDDSHSRSFYRAIDYFLESYHAAAFDDEVSDAGSFVEDMDELSADDVLGVFKERAEQKCVGVQDVLFSGFDLDLVRSAIQRSKYILNQALAKISVAEVHLDDFNRAVEMFRQDLGYQEEACQFESDMLRYPNLQTIDHFYLN